jgi:hypothetical protein
MALLLTGCPERPIPLTFDNVDGGGADFALGGADLAASDLAASDLSTGDRGPEDLAGVDLAGLAPARLIAPLSTSTVTSRRPTLRWSIGDKLRTQVELCADRACIRPLAMTVVETAPGSGQPDRDLPTGPVFWRVLTAIGGGFWAESATWEFFVGARSAPVDASFGATLDVDGDGRPDLAVGALGIDAPGAVYLYRNGPSGLGAPQVIAIDDPTLWSAWLVAPAGDLDGDGYGDLAVSSIAVSSALPDGLVRIYRGGPGGIDPSRALLLMPIDTPADPAGGNQFGRTVGGAGDVNGDGYGDLLITTAGTDQPHAYVLFGGPDGVRTDDPSRFLRLTFSTQNVGLASAACDFNGDGYGDLLLGSPYEMAGSAQNVGEAFVYLGGPKGLGPQIVLSPSPPDQYFGWSTTAQDVDGDGYCDAIVATSQDQIYVFTGGAGPMMATTPARALAGTAGFNFVANAGDVDGDGFGDLVLGGQGARAVSVVFGGRFTTTLLRPMGSGYGWVVDGAGDLDGDGFGEVAVGANSSPPAQVLVYAGKGLAAGPPDGGITVLDGPTDGGARYGYSLAGLR